jgi:hypothetical protein
MRKMAVAFGLLSLLLLPLAACTSTGMASSSTTSLMNITNGVNLVNTIVKDAQQVIAAEVAAGTLKPAQTATLNTDLAKLAAVTSALQAATNVYSAATTATNGQAVGTQIQAALAAVQVLGTDLTAAGFLKGPTATDVSIGVLGLQVLVAGLQADGLIK